MNRQSVRYRILTIPKKMTVDMRVSAAGDSRPEFYSHGRNNDSDCTSITIFPIISIALIRPGIIDDNGNYIKAKWDPNDSIALTKYNLPLFINELREIYNNFKEPKLFSYTGERLELNAKLAEKFRKVFMIGDTTIELSIVVINELENDREIFYEGLKVKFNNEDHVGLLNINDLSSLLYTLTHVDMDSLALSLYKTYIRDAFRNNR